MSNEDFRNAPSASQYLFADLGIDLDQQSTSFDPNNQPKYIGVPSSKIYAKNENKYAYSVSQEYNLNVRLPHYDIDIEIPYKLNMDSSVTPNTVSSPQSSQSQKEQINSAQSDTLESLNENERNSNKKYYKQYKQSTNIANVKGRKKESSKNKLKNIKKHKNDNEKYQKETEIDLEFDEVAEWGYKGTAVNKQSDDPEDEYNSFDEEYNVKLPAINYYQYKIKEKLEQKLRNFGNNVQHQKNTLSSLKQKAYQLKQKNSSPSVTYPLNKNTYKSSKSLFILEEYVEVNKNIGYIGTKVYESTKGIAKDVPQTKESLSIASIPTNKEQKNINTNEEKNENESDSSDSSDVWEKVNAGTLAKQQELQQRTLMAQNIDIDLYFQNLHIYQDVEEEDQGEDEGSFWTQIFGCLGTNKKKNRSEAEKQMLKLSKVQLTNKPEELQMLKDIWSDLTAKKYIRFGEHWNEVGFQGRDPATDLRGTGILSLIHWRSFIKKHQQYAISLCEFCEQYDIPLALTHIKVTDLLCNLIRKKKVSSREWKELQECYNALAVYTFEYVRENGKDLDELGEFIEKAILRTERNINSANSLYKAKFF